MNDFRFALRQLRKSPGFTALAIITLALGIGVNSAIFALVNGVVLRPMVPLRPAEVVNIFTARQNTNHDYRQFSHTESRDAAKLRLSDFGKFLLAHGRAAAAWPLLYRRGMPAER